MNESDVIESLKQKEDELDNLLNEAREKALQIKQDAARKAEELKLSRATETDRMVEEYKKIQREKIDKEAEDIQAEAIKKVHDLKLTAEQRQDKAIGMVVSCILIRTQ